ncbi:hypothetical protein [Pedobacter puniceum]|uniref:Uncharacterized protein n=1 Tax=Pedobacter puniceum TaxID=2666136 RepID=A0A7K0FJT9_9SPHI|nr:hypothetical protein [Pedobacter puniceum]MRX46216.1 hypothetical protein [Pedobacter puniceum]
MKNIKLSTLIYFFCLICSTSTLRAQNSVSYFISLRGEISIKIDKADFFVCISTTGEIVNFSALADGNISRNFNEKIDRIGKVNIAYDIHDRISKIGDESISYDIHGRVGQIGETRISYNIHDKLDYIGDKRVYYDIHGRIERIGQIRVSYDIHGRLDKLQKEEDLFYHPLNYGSLNEPVYVDIIEK